MIRLDKLLDVIGTDGNNKYVATKMNLESGDVIGTSFEISSNWVDERITFELETWQQDNTGKNTLHPVFHLDIGFNDETIPQCEVDRAFFWGAPQSSQKVDLESLAPLMREIIASLRKGLVPDLTRLMLHIRQEGAS